MYFLADFNRKINLSHITKTTTPFGIMRQGVKRSRDALTDLIKRGGKKQEGAYLLNERGKLSQYVTSNKHNTVDVMDLLTGKSEVPTRPISAVLHNHPFSTGLSNQDFMGTTPPKYKYAKVNGKIVSTQVAAPIRIANSTPSGSIYHGYITEAGKNMYPSAREQMFKSTYDKMYKTTGEEMKKLKPGKWTSKDTDSWNFVSTHLKNRILSKSGLVHYRAKFSPKDKRTLDFWLQKSPKLKNIYDGN